MRSYSLKWRLVSSLLLVFLCLWSMVFAWLYVDLQKRLQDTLDQRLLASAQMVARLIQQLPMQALNNELNQHPNKPAEAENLIACEVSLFSSDISIGQHVVAKTRGAPLNLSQQQLGFSTWQQGGVEWRSYVLRKNDIHTWVQENGVAGMVALAQYFSKMPLKCRPKTFEFAFNTAHLHMSKEGTNRYMKNLNKEYEAKKVNFVFAVEHLGTREILAKPRQDGKFGRTLEFSGTAEPQGWFVPEDHPLMQKIATDAAKRRQLPSVFVGTGQDAPVANRLPKQCSFGGLGNISHSYMMPTMATISASWSLWAPSFGKDAIDFNLMRNQLLAIGDSVLELQNHSQAEIEGPYADWKVARDQGKLVCKPASITGVEDAPL